MNPARPKAPFIKVCGQTHPACLDAAAAAGVQMVGFIFHQRSPRAISPERARVLQTAHTVKRVGVFVKQSAEEISSIMEQARLDFAQLHGRQGTEVADAIDPRRVIRVLWPEQCESTEALQKQIDAWEPHCAYYLLDAGGTGSGGTGRSMDVRELDKLRFPHPWLLAGGLTPDNVQDLLAQCHPDGIDLNSGLEFAPGIKNNMALFRTVRAVSDC